MFVENYSLLSPDSVLLYPHTGALIVLFSPWPWVGEVEEGGGQGRVQEAAVGRGGAVSGAVALLLHARASVKRAHVSARGPRWDSWAPPDLEAAVAAAAVSADHHLAVNR